MIEFTFTFFDLSTLTVVVIFIDCGPVSGGGSEAGVKGYQEVVGAGHIGCVWDAYGGSGGGTDRGGGQNGYGDRDRLSQW